MDSEFLKAAQIAIAERDRYKAESEAKTEVITAKDSQIAALRGLIDIQKQISKDWMDSALQRKDALILNEKLVKVYDDKVLSLQNERDSARRQNKVWGAVGLVLGVALGVYAAK